MVGWLFKLTQSSRWRVQTGETASPVRNARTYPKHWTSSSRAEHSCCSRPLSREWKSGWFLIRFHAWIGVISPSRLSANANSNRRSSSIAGTSHLLLEWIAEGACARSGAWHVKAWPEDDSDPAAGRVCPRQGCSRLKESIREGYKGGRGGSDRVWEDSREHKINTYFGGIKALRMRFLRALGRGRLSRAMLFTHAMIVRPLRLWLRHTYD